MLGMGMGMGMGMMVGGRQNEPNSPVPAEEGPSQAFSTASVHVTFISHQVLHTTITPIDHHIALLLKNKFVPLCRSIAL